MHEFSEEARAEIEALYRQQLDAGYTPIAAANFAKTSYAMAVANTFVDYGEVGIYLTDRYRAARELAKTTMGVLLDNLDKPAVL